MVKRSNNNNNIFFRCQRIGVWYEVMRVMVFVGILTNCAILGFSSEQLMQWIPSLFSRESEGGDQIMVLGSGRWVLIRQFFINVR